MAVDIAKLSVNLLRGELDTLGLETTGKKADLVQRLKAALESTEKSGDNEDDEVDEVDEVAEVAEVEDVTMKDESTAEKPEEVRRGPKKWLHVLAGSRVATSKNRHLEVVQKMCLSRRRKDIYAARVQHEVHAFPLAPLDLSDLRILELLEKCSTVSVNFFAVPSEEGSRELKGYLKLTFSKKDDALNNLETLAEFKEGMHVYHVSMDEKLDKFKTDWRMENQGSTDPPEKFLHLVPRCPEGMSEDQLWELFPLAREIFTCPKRVATAKVGGEDKSSEQPPYVYLQFPNTDLATKNFTNLNTVEPTDDMKQLCVIPFMNKPEWTKDADKNGTKSNVSADTNNSSKTPPKSKGNIGAKTPGQEKQSQKNTQKNTNPRPKSFGGYQQQRSGGSWMSKPMNTRGSYSNYSSSVGSSAGRWPSSEGSSAGRWPSSEAAAMLSRFSDSIRPTSSYGSNYGSSGYSGGYYNDYDDDQEDSMYNTKRTISPAFASNMMAGKRMRYSGDFGDGYEDEHPQRHGFGGQGGYESEFLDIFQNTSDIARLENLRIGRGGSQSIGRGGSQRGRSRPLVHRRGKSHYVPKMKKETSD